MGCGSSRDVEVQTHYRETSEPETTVSSVDQGSRLEPEGQESEGPKHDSNGQHVRSRHKPQRELWAHPPNPSPKRPCPKPKSGRAPRPTPEPGHSVKDLRRRQGHKDSEENFLMLDDQDNQ